MSSTSSDKDQEVPSFLVVTFSFVHKNNVKDELLDPTPDGRNHDRRKVMVALKKMSAQVSTPDHDDG